MAQAWVAQDKLLPLLDGLDEVQSAQRVACAEAINQFHAGAPCTPGCPSLVWPSMEKSTVRLSLQGVVLLRTAHYRTNLTVFGTKLAHARRCS